MVSSPASTVAAYLTSLPADRRAVMSAVRDVVNKHLPRGYEECMQYGMISWVVPLARSGATYNQQPLAVAALAAQKNNYSLYLMGAYTVPGLAAWFADAYRRTGKKLDMGKSCVRFKSLETLALDIVGQVVAKVSVDEFLAAHEAGRPAPKKTAPPASQAPAKKVSAKQASAKVSAKQVSAKQVSAKQVSAKQVSAKQASAKKAPATKAHATRS